MTKSKKLFKIKSKKEIKNVIKAETFKQNENKEILLKLIIFVN